jgi:hypothetical protein
MGNRICPHGVPVVSHRGHGNLDAPLFPVQDDAGIKDGQMSVESYIISPLVASFVRGVNGPGAGRKHLLAGDWAAVGVEKIAQKQSRLPRRSACA